MGRRLLLIPALGLAGFLAAFAGTNAPDRSTDLHLQLGEPDPHEGLNCSACHAYTLESEARLARERLGLADSVTVGAPTPEARCTGSGCHEDRGPREVTFGSVTFPHRDHGEDADFPPDCAACHGHDAGPEPMSTSVDACSLCHLNEQSAGGDGECRQCHSGVADPAQVAGSIPIPHEGLPWIDGGCVRCHYDVSRAPLRVEAGTCKACHAPDEAVVARGVGEDLHGDHPGIGCSSCHVEESHRIRAMSSAVALECADCHATSHDLALSRAWPRRETCATCHAEVHAPQQRLLLGIVPGHETAHPSEKFMAGLTCRSCHEPPDPDPAVAAGVIRRVQVSEPAVRGSAVRCETCHRDGYAEVLAWWQDGGRARVAMVRSMVERTESRLVRALPARGSTPDGENPRDPDPWALLDSATLFLELVENAGVAHNLALAHELLQESADAAGRASLLAGTSPVAPPALGRAPAVGLCSYCHYRTDDPMIYRDMPADFHREVMERGLRGSGGR